MLSQKRSLLNRGRSIGFGTRIAQKNESIYSCWVYIVHARLNYTVTTWWRIYYTSPFTTGETGAQWVLAGLFSFSVLFVETLGCTIIHHLRYSTRLHYPCLDRKFPSAIKSCNPYFSPELLPWWLLPGHSGISQNLPKHGKTLLRPRSCSRTSQQTSLTRLEVCPLRVCVGVEYCPVAPLFSSTCFPCPSNSCPLRILPFIQSFPPLRVTVTYSLAQWHLFPGGPFPSHTESLPLGVPCPWGLPCHLSELSLFCTPQKTENPRRQGLFGLLCTNWVSGWPPRHKWDEYQRRVKPWLCPFLGPGCVRSWWNRVLASPGHHAGWMRQAGAPG